MSEASPRFQLPFIVPGQAQKELFHNEALLRVDALLHAAVEAVALPTPPVAPAEGQCWTVGAAPSGAWAGRENQVAMWSEGGWRFVVPAIGMVLWDKAAGVSVRWTGSGWTGGEISGSALIVSGQQVVGVRQPAVPSASGGTVIDAEARAALNAVIAALMSHGLID
jgi:hypothetical protein